MEGWDIHKAIFISRVVETVKYPKEETSYYFIPKRDFLYVKGPADNSWTEEEGSNQEHVA